MKIKTEFVLLATSVIGSVSLIAFLAFANSAYTCSALSCAISAISNVKI